MMRSSAFMRGEGAPAAVRRSNAAFRACLNCTYLFHHGDTEKSPRMRESQATGRLETDGCNAVSTCQTRQTEGQPPYHSRKETGQRWFGIGCELADPRQTPPS